MDKDIGFIAIAIGIAIRHTVMGPSPIFFFEWLKDLIGLFNPVDIKRRIGEIETVDVFRV